MVVRLDFFLEFDQGQGILALGNVVTVYRSVNVENNPTPIKP